MKMKADSSAVQKYLGISHLNDVIAQFDETAFTCQKTGMAHELQMDEKYADFCDVNGQKFIKRACEVLRVVCTIYCLSDLPVQARQ